MKQLPTHARLAASALLSLLSPAVVLAEPAPAPANQASGKIPVKTADDLPRHSYKVEGKASEFLLSDKPFKDFVAQVKANLQSDLDKYDIQDRTTLQAYYTTLQQIAIFENRQADAIALLAKIRELETKESKKLMNGQVLLSLFEAEKIAGADQAKFQAAFKSELQKRISALPWDKVGEDVKSAKGRAEILRKDLVMGQVSAQLDPMVAMNKNELSGDFANTMIAMRVTIDRILPVQPMVAEVYSGIIASHAAPRSDTWTPNLVRLDPSEKATPVVICIWDSGVDTSLYSGNLWVNEKEKANGKDNDGNGFVGDVNGIAYDKDGKRESALLHSVSGMKSPLDTVTKYAKGSQDVQASVDSPEATEFKKYITSLKPEQVKDFQEDLGLFGMYSHGTHVAGIASEGNPFARILVARLAFDYRTIPETAPSEEQARAIAAMYRDTVNYMKAAGVRVVNMSWGGSRKDVENELEQKGIGANKEERAEMSRKIFKIGKDALQEAIAGAPGILFVAAAGNSDNDNDFSEMIPSALTCPNLITIGAIDSSGKPTGFTTFGKGVTLYANGFEVESYIPGGKRLKFSGTSMASPNVANLAGKVLALDPRLTPSQVVDLITKNADPMEGYPGRLIINPKKTIAALKR
ncbi:MAG: S8 family serine peptidase [Phycisphaerales bacterium]|nr:S8 family serine peptidase [Planctomycetota bacterium]